MRKLNGKESSQKGSLMVEALALLGLITMVTPILYKKAAERTTELQDINVATQMRTISSAVDQYIKDNYKEVGDTHTDEIFTLTADEMEKVREYLPHGFESASSKMFDDFRVSVRKKEVVDLSGTPHNVFTSAILAPLKDDISIMRSSKIASMIGVNGGVYRKTGSDDQINGVQGTWQATMQDFGLEVGEGDDAVKSGSLVVISTDAISSANAASTATDSDNFLYRIDSGDPSTNTMQTTLYMDGNEIAGVGNLIAAAGTVSVGSETTPSNLEVLGDLIVDGAAEIASSLTIGDTENGFVKAHKGEFDEITINGDLTAGKFIATEGGVEIQKGGLTVTEGGANITGDTTINGNTNITGDLAQSGDNVSLSGGTSVSITGPANTINMGGSNMEVSGPTTFKDEVTFENKVIIEGVGGEIVLNPDDEVDGESASSVTADWIIANTGFKLAGDSFVVTSAGGKINSLWVSENDFRVGGDEQGSNARINVDGTSSYIGMGDGTGLVVDANNTKLQHGNTLVDINGSSGIMSFDAENGDAWVKVSQNEAIMGVNDPSNPTSALRTTDEMAGMELLVGTGTGAAHSSVYLTQDGLDVDTKNVLIDQYGMAIAANDAEFSSGDLSNDVGADGALKFTEGNVVPDSILTNNSNVSISRHGIIEVRGPDGTNGKGGFIRARRLVSDVPYPQEDAFHEATIGASTNEGDAVKRYDYYQVNPAYTSVMNDIKLASRGGARLSDILPDFITKGIYVVDNTYADEEVPAWEDDDGNGLVRIGSANVTELGRLESDDMSDLECEDTACKASPWLGFVPAPQCPRNYNKAISISPFRWRMAEAFALTTGDQGSDINDRFSEGNSNYIDMIQGRNESTGTGFSRFDNNFERKKNPRDAVFEIYPAAVGNGSEHTHTHGATPLTFQINTRLNTTMSQVFDENSSDQNAETLLGWHAIMGFLYDGGSYADVIKEILGLDDDDDSISSDDLFWNVFPVYAQDMAAVATVYCLFDRNPLINGTRQWVWPTGEGSPVDPYDQMHNFRKGFERSDNWVDAVNDPDLGYDDPW